MRKMRSRNLQVASLAGNICSEKFLQPCIFKGFSKTDGVGTRLAKGSGTESESSSCRHLPKNECYAKTCFGSQRDYKLFVRSFGLQNKRHIWSSFTCEHQSQKYYEELNHHRTRFKCFHIVPNGRADGCPATTTNLPIGSDRRAKKRVRFSIPRYTFQIFEIDPKHDQKCRPKQTEIILGTSGG